jgi:hypothetical protein
MSSFACHQYSCHPTVKNSSQFDLREWLKGLSILNLVLGSRVPPNRQLPRAALVNSLAAKSLAFIF